MYIILIISLIFFCLLNWKIFNDFLCPSGLYTSVLLIAALYGCFWYDEWELNTYGFKTYLVIMIGVVCFSGISWLLHSINKNVSEEVIDIVQGGIYPSKIKWFVVMILELISILFAFQFYGGSLSNLSNEIIAYRVSKTLEMPSFLSLLLNMTMISGYFSAYIVINNFLLFKEISVKWCLVFILSILICLLGGSRGGSISIIVVAFAIFYVYFHRMAKTKKNIKRQRRIRWLICIVVILGILFFIESSSWIGRTMLDSPAYYFAIYLSAPLKNLDINIKAIDAGQKITGNAFTNINGLSLGNVGTIYTYEYINGGILEVIVISLIVGLIIGILYENIKQKKINSNKIDIRLIVYGYIYYAVSMIIFGSTLISSIFSIFFIKVMIGIIVFLYFFNITFLRREGKIIIKKGLLK